MLHIPKKLVQEAHPRVSGENMRPYTPVPAEKGSSPRELGKRTELKLGKPIIGLIPA